MKISHADYYVNKKRKQYAGKTTRAKRDKISKRFSTCSMARIKETQFNDLRIQSRSLRSSTCFVGLEYFKAIENFKKVLDLWKDVDPGIPEVEHAKKRLMWWRQ